MDKCLWPVDDKRAFHSSFIAVPECLADSKEVPIEDKELFEVMEAIRSWGGTYCPWCGNEIEEDVL